MDFDPSSLLSMSKDGCRKITALHVTLNAAINWCCLAIELFVKVISPEVMSASWPEEYISWFASDAIAALK